MNPCILQPETGSFVLGHPVAKSPNSAYRLAASFRDILLSPEGEWDEHLKEWILADNVRLRLRTQAELAELAKTAVDTKHSDLIRACQQHYAPRFLAGYQVIYIDDGDGDRITKEQQVALASAGITLTLDDAIPDILLWHPTFDSLWVIEAVTSDGEVDLHKFRQLTGLAHRSGKKEIGFTTAYKTWKAASSGKGASRIWRREPICG